MNVRSTKSLILACLCAVCAVMPLYSQEQKNMHFFYGFVGDNLTHEALKGTTVKCYDKNNACIDSTVVSNMGIFDVVPAWIARIPSVGKYRLLFSCEGYEDKTVTVEVNNFIKTKLP